MTSEAAINLAFKETAHSQQSPAAGNGSAILTMGQQRGCAQLARSRLPSQYLSDHGDF